MPRFIVISDSFLSLAPHAGSRDGKTYIDRQKIVSVHTGVNILKEKIIEIRTLDGEAFEFLYDETHPEWVTLFSWLNK